jgi:hypothetical protein
MAGRQTMDPSTSVGMTKMRFLHAAFFAIHCGIFILIAAQIAHLRSFFAFFLFTLSVRALPLREMHHTLGNDHIVFGNV